MWVWAVAAGIVVASATVVGLGLLARFLPPGRARELAALIPNCIILLRRLRSVKGLPWRGRAALGVAIAYLLSPVQLIPNFIPVIGQTDDVAVVILAIRYACRLLPEDEVRAAWPGEQGSLDRLLGRRARARRQP